MNDTSKAVEAKYREMLLSLPPQRRFYLAAGMFSDARPPVFIPEKVLRSVMS
jgi:hypothetical protein